MARNRIAVVVLLAALALASGARVPLQAATSTTADVVFIMEAAQATFTNATTLALNGLAGSAQSYAAGAKTGIYPIQNFTDGSATSQYVDSNGQWLSNPQAVMYGVDQTGAVTTVLLTLSNPTVPQQPAGTVTNNNNNNNGGSTTTNNNNNGPPQLTFTVALVPAQASAVKYQNGVVAEKITEASNGAGNLTTSITPGATFSPVVIYIDQNQQGLPKKATTKWGYGGWGNGWNNGYYNNGWGYNSGYSSNNNNNNNNNGGWGANNNNNNNNNNGGWGASNNNNNNNNNNGGWGSSNNNNNNNNNGGWGSSNNNNNNNNNGK